MVRMEMAKGPLAFLALLAFTFLLCFSISAGMFLLISKLFSLIVFVLQLSLFEGCLVDSTSCAFNHITFTNRMEEMGHVFVFDSSIDLHKFCSLHCLTVALLLFSRTTEVGFLLSVIFLRWSVRKGEFWSVNLQGMDDWF